MEGQFSQCTQRNENVSVHLLLNTHESHIFITIKLERGENLVPTIVSVSNHRILVVAREKRWQRTPFPPFIFIPSSPNAKATANS
jgi:hypothetical protein